MSSARDKYQQAFAEFMGAERAWAFGMGRHALAVLLKALGAGAGTRVGVCGFTCLSVPEAILRIGATPIYIDVDETLCIDPAELAKLNPGDLDILILQHTFGLAGKLDELFFEAKRIGATIIEDCAHCFASKYKGKLLGTFAPAAIFSSQWGKSYSTGQGGMLIANDNELAEKIEAAIARLARPMSFKADAMLAAQRTVFAVLGGPKAFMTLRAIYRKFTKAGVVKGSFSHELDFTSCEDFVELAGALQSRSGLRQLRNWPALENIRTSNVKMIESEFQQAQLPLWRAADCDAVMLRYPLLTDRREEILAFAEENRFDIAGWYDTPVHPVESHQLDQVGYQAGTCPAAEKMISQLVHLPTGKTCSCELVRKFIEFVKTHK